MLRKKARTFEHTIKKLCHHVEIPDINRVPKTQMFAYN